MAIVVQNRIKTQRGTCFWTRAHRDAKPRKLENNHHGDNLINHRMIQKEDLSTYPTVDAKFNVTVDASMSPWETGGKR